EVELIDGPAELLGPVGERLVAAGAEWTARASKLARALGLDEVDRPAPRPGKKRRRAAEPRAADVLLGVLRDQVTALQLADVAVRTGQDDAIRRLRVAYRRLRALLAAARPVLDRAATDPLRAELRLLAGRLSDVRDEEVALAELRAAVTEVPVELVLGPVEARLRTAQVAAAERGRATAAALVAGPDHRRALDALHALLADPPITAAGAEPARPVLDGVVRREVRRLRRAADAGGALSGQERTEALHGVRRTARRTRYVAAAFAPALGERAATAASAAKRTQRLLGELQDLVVVGEHCRGLAVAAHAAGEPGFTYGLLLGRAEARARDAERVFAERWPDLAARLRRSVR
ncbi:CHAD domain-containing protein, partial [Blastococcus sp. CCUG 61487]|uniref:CYTH and CHAD domain-containing protein n=1 Tax=Blastococcus sp. CCUG 61487 TaxID=1840703 RepID=UPI0010BF84F5